MKVIHLHKYEIKLINLINLFWFKGFYNVALESACVVIAIIFIFIWFVKSDPKKYECQLIPQNLNIKLSTALQRGIHLLHTRDITDIM